ncbi:MAG: hypothetical protein M3N54_00110 [Acidobacteriota bacterium]|nr:hypothetical protein [Acidobacteriota bacterium]
MVIDSEPPDVIESCLDSLDGLRADDVKVSVLKQNPGESLMQVRARAAAGVHTEFVVFMYARYRVTRGWTRAMLQAHKSGSAVVGGSVIISEDRRNARFTGDRSIYLWEYAPAAPPVTARKSAGEQGRSFPGGNTSYRTEILRQYDIGRYANEMDFHRALAEAGFNLHQSPEAATIYLPPPIRAYLSELYRVSREYSASRGGSGFQRMVRAGAAVALLPSYLLIKNFARVWRKPHYRWWLPGSLPWFVLFALVQTGGTVAGYLGRKTPLLT